MSATSDKIKQEDQSFRLSRIQAMGWSAARSYLRDGDPTDREKIDALNPHKTGAERVRWFAGFDSALDKL
jgi:hypothetical protein